MLTGKDVLDLQQTAAANFVAIIPPIVDAVSMRFGNKSAFLVVLNSLMQNRVTFLTSIGAKADYIGD